MSRARVVYHMVRADFLERVRRYSFLITMGFSVYLGYAVYAGQVTLRLDTYRGVNNSAWLGSVIGLVGSVWLSLIGFYVVKNTIQRDRETRVGQILATTPMSKSFYTLSKMLSNFAVLAAMVCVLAIAGLIIQLAHGEVGHVDLAALFAPSLVFGLTAVAITAALAVLFESLPVLRGGVGNVLYFFLWTILLAAGASSIDKTRPDAGPASFVDFTGIVSTMSQMQAQLRGMDPQYNGGASFSVGGMSPTTKTFVWTGLHWTEDLVLSRLLLLGIAVALALLAAVFFDRFAPTRAGLSRKKRKTAEVADESGGSEAKTPVALQTAGQLTALARGGTRLGARSRFFGLVAAELRLMLRGHAWWWYAVAAALFIGCLAAPLESARSGVILAAWLWPALVWSQMGTREAQFATGPIIFSTQRAFPRQLLATWSAGVLVAMLTGGGLGLHLLAAGDFAGLGTWAAGALFIPAMALALGVCTESRKPFEALYTAWWYVGPLHHLSQLDFMGTTAQSSTPGIYLAGSALLLGAALAWRRMRTAYA